MKNQQKVLAVSAISLVLFGLLSLLVEFEMTQGFDESINYFYTSKASDVLFLGSIALHYLFDTTTMVFATVILFSYLFYKKRKSDALMVFTGMMLDVILVWGIKHLIERSRPFFYLLQDHGFSFPSGHATVSMVFLGLFGTVLYSNIKTKKEKMILGTLFGILIGMVGFSRIYLGVHYFTDVFGGFLLGTSILCITLYIFKKSDIFLSSRV